MGGRKPDHCQTEKKSKRTKRELTTALFLLRCLQLGITLRDLDQIDIGMIFDMMAERSNDDIEWPVVATQEDMDRL